MVITLGYWPIKGRLEIMRQFCALHGLQIEEWNPAGPEAWGEKKAEFIKSGKPFANLPFFQEGDFTLFESAAIIRHLARKVSPDLLGKNPQDKAVVESYTSFLKDFDSAIPFIMTHDNAGAKPLFAEALEKKIMPMFQKLSSALGTKSTFLGYQTLLDHLVYYAVANILVIGKSTGVPVTLPDNLDKFIKAYVQQPKLAEYLNSPAAKARPFAPPGMIKFEFKSD